ncbi:hypothetical protein Poly24_27190 [Rosistilla carotiformis]|uniref:Uncharacterized protein n=1 Tax=Rosistilla carotiformis TaxID=2528017 RepID=A0A518JTZ5_9BACT|nr:hypothetical protein Poly24_27190 [Rosistilla carotiformis]
MNLAVMKGLGLKAEALRFWRQPLVPMVRSRQFSGLAWTAQEMCHIIIASRLENTNCQSLNRLEWLFRLQFEA